MSSICKCTSAIECSCLRIYSTAILKAGYAVWRFSFASASNFSYGDAALRRMSFKFRTLTCFSVPILEAS